ncbi:MAG: hypothetical protein ACR2GU_06550 [Rubrobacteraceae bacterium]
MDEKQQKQINEAAAKFADAIKESYQAVAERSESAQDLNAELTQNFFNAVIENLSNQAESNRALYQDLIEQQKKQREATRGVPGDRQRIRGCIHRFPELDVLLLPGECREDEEGRPELA